ncbi:hypothetical protein AN958_10551 [Leucoagaricus sp. SymC.cos]|nr:hypothetical protein AN958_10551 [Leucoagaricus sp. SymC.cos]
MGDAAYMWDIPGSYFEWHFSTSFNITASSSFLSKILSRHNPFISWRRRLRASSLIVLSGNVALLQTAQESIRLVQFRTSLFGRGADALVMSS